MPKFQVMQAYCVFCDCNSIKRIDATPEETLTNLNAMAQALAEMMIAQRMEIAARCPACNGTGKVAHG